MSHQKSDNFVAMQQMRRAVGHSQEEAQIVETCARIIAEEGEQDFTRATRKALARLGLPENTRHPRHVDITLALNHYLALFQADSQPQALQRLRLEARSILRLLERALPDCAPVLKGAVALGHANAFSAIEIELTVDDFKTFDFFLFDHEIETRIEADGNYHGDHNDERGSKHGSQNKAVIYHVLHTACDVKFKPILRAAMASRRPKIGRLQPSLKDGHPQPSPKIGRLQPIIGQENDVDTEAKITGKSPMTLQELEVLLAADDDASAK